MAGDYTKILCLGATLMHEAEPVTIWLHPVIYKVLESDAKAELLSIEQSLSYQINTQNVKHVYLKSLKLKVLEFCTELLG